MVIEQDYYTPEGCLDRPYLHVFDATSLVDGTSPRTLIQPMEYDNDFVLRAILGVPYVVDPVVGGFKLYNYSGSAAYSNPVTTMSNQVAVVPEKIYPKNSAIRFDLTTVLRKNIACGFGTIFYPQLVFQGVQRYRPGDPGYPVGSPQPGESFDPSKFELRPWTYTLKLNLNWFKWISAGVADTSRTFVIAVQDYAFELHYMRVGNAAAGGGGGASPDLFQMTLYDATAKRALSDLPVNQSYWNNNRAAFGNPVFPVPPIVYPVWTQIKVDIWSLVCNTDLNSPYALNIDFVGVNRVPKVGA